MRLLPLIILFLYVYIEVSIFVIVANHIGVLLALIALVATSILGVSVVKSQGLKNIVQMQQKMQLGENPSQEVGKSVSIFLGGFLLLIPGFVTDILGACLLLPIVQHFAAKYIIPWLNIKTQFRYAAGQDTSANKQADEVIEGSFSRKDDEEITK